MKEKTAKGLRRTARNEMASDKVPDRDLVMGNRSVVNSPQSVRAMYLALKKAFKAIRSHTTVALQNVVRIRKSSGLYRPQDLKAIPALIQRPLKQLLKRADGHRACAVYQTAKALAGQGRGGELQQLARKYL